MNSLTTSGASRCRAVPAFRTATCLSIPKVRGSVMSPTEDRC
jgi:hypothetical protein